MTSWKKRATVYNNLEWTKNKKFMQAIITAGDFHDTDCVLDVGTGTGLVAETVAPMVTKVVAIDESPHMLGLATKKHSNIEWQVGDARDLQFEDCSFDAVTARYVFHHIIDNTAKAMDECYRVLKHGGIMVFAEGVPPTHRVKPDFIKIFELKEQRITFMAEDMADLMSTSGFTRLHKEHILLEKMSVRNWVSSSGLPKKLQETIFQMHRDAPDYFKEDYCMVETDNDCLLNMRIAIVSGVKF